MSLQRLAWVLAGLTLLLLVVGGAVHATGSSLACPDWPLCYGQAFPEMKGGVLFEHSHRLIATLVGLVTLVLSALMIWRHGPGDGVRALGVAAVVDVFVQEAGLMAALAGGELSLILLASVGVLVVATLGIAALLYRRGAVGPALGVTLFQLVGLQGMLGGLTVVLKLPLLVSAAHLALSLGFFSLLVFLGFRLRSPSTGSSVRAARHWVGLAALAVYLQAVLGGFVRHTGSGLACNVTLFSCNGSLVPDGGPAWLNWSHRLFAVVVAVFVTLVAANVASDAGASGRQRARTLSLAIVAAALLQLVVGALTVASFIAVSWVVIHLGIAALLLALTLALYLELGPLGDRAKTTAGVALPATGSLG